MRKQFTESIIIGVSLLLLAAPCIVKQSHAEVVIDDARTVPVVLENETNSTDSPENVTVKSGASVIVAHDISLFDQGGDGIASKSTDGWNVTVEKGATVKSVDGGNNAAINLRFTTGATVTNSGELTGVSGGVRLGSYGTIINDGTINTTVNYAVSFAGDGGTVDNKGAINAGTTGAAGVFFGGSGNKVTNREGGTITGGRGVSGHATVINEKGATITGTTDQALYISGDSHVFNEGTIIGATTGIQFRGSGARSNILDNRGTIIGAGGNAVLMGAGNDTAYLRDGSDITGNVDGDNSADSSIVSGTDDRVYLTGSGEIKNGTLLNFETIEKSGDGTWSLGGDLSSGKSISVLGGALKVSGVYTHEAGATYTVGAGSDGKAGKITADTAVLNGGGVSVVTKGLKGGTHTIVETTNGLTGTFDSVTSDSKYREMSLAYDAKNSYLNMRSNFKKAGARGTRGNVASAIDDAYSNSSSDDMVTVVDELFTLDDGALNSALDQISGTTHSVSSTVAPARQGAFYQNLFGRTGGTTGLGFLGLNDRQSDPLTMLASGGPVASDAGFTLTRDGQKLPYGTWIKGYSVTGNRHGDDVGSRYDYTIGGAIAGFDYLINPNIRAGVAVGYSKTNVDMKQLRDNSDAESWQGAIYGSYVPTSKLWYVDAAFAYSKNSYETKRYLNFGNIYRVARGSYDGSDISGYLEGGYKVPIFGGITATPLASFLAMCNHTDSFTETGAGALNLESDSNHTDSYQSGLGVKLSREFKAAKDFTLTPEFGAKWLHEFGDTEANINARFAGEPAGSFVINSSTAKRDTGVFSLNLTGKKSDMLNFFVGYDLGITSDQISHGFTGGLRFNW